MASRALPRLACRLGLARQSLTLKAGELPRPPYSHPQRYTHTFTRNGGPLQGVRILDLTRVLAGPFCTQILADYGADVLKIENPKGGDDTRLWRTAAEKDIWKATEKDISAYFCTINRNKRSMTLNFKHEQGRRILFRLVKRADVVVDNFVPGKMDDLGIGYKKLREINPAIIHASISGYGAGGPYSQRAGYDAIAAAEAGLMHITGERDGPPTRPGLGLVDMSTGLFLHGAILAALYMRQQTGKGQKIDGSLFESQISLLTNVAMSWLNGGVEAQRWGTAHPSIVPYQAFKTTDSYIVLGAVNNRQYQLLCKLLDRQDLATDPRFAENTDRVQNRDELTRILSEIIERKSTEEWLSTLEGSGMTYGPINTIEKVFAHPQTKAREMVQNLPYEAASSGEIKVLGFPVKFSETSPAIRMAPPGLGEHTEATLMDMGFSREEVQDMREQMVI
ncbi:hypothetical protein N7532_000805 [Penicillium argentinense]|uniref:Uncharacterized protein n=1 Tax=Penicillium argentinense TaxID=1131581 RepID=A0A9W9G6X1_9EURO|nr:uncharacterized protein N7532_000805 [Penicillium argentinense]KAJ5112760.1 hypothetical protein N7532_000805 [Penicillium argentinense]